AWRFTIPLVGPAFLLSRRERLLPQRHFLRLCAEVLLKRRRVPFNPFSLCAEFRLLGRDRLPHPLELVPDLRGFRVIPVLQLRQFELPRFELLRRRLDVLVFSLKPELGLPECFLRCGEPALSLGQLTAFRFDRLGVLLEIRFHLAELGGPCGMQLLEVGSLRGDVALERVQTFRLLREFNRVMRGLLSEGPLSRFKFQKPLLALALDSFRRLVHLGSDSGGFFRRRLATFEFLLRSSDSVGVPTNSLFPFLDVDLSGLVAHPPICTGGSLCRGLLLERLSLLLALRLFGLARALPSTSFRLP